MQIVGEWKMQFGRCMDRSLVIGSSQWTRPNTKGEKIWTMALGEETTHLVEREGMEEEIGLVGTMTVSSVGTQGIGLGIAP